MKTLNIVTRLSVVSALVFSLSIQAQGSLNPQIESALIEVCKSVQKDNVWHLRKTIKSHRLNEGKVANAVVCNGENIIQFAESAEAYKTAQHLNKRLGGSEIVDLAQVVRVDF
ncbi:DUF3718 domain-containing protein [Thalassotalea aquiviva]|uniref:DUF3718 domain-containing protein n=1 Tax=Thalassotalea aquiviva TaxID=3242415 RepID=UPI00352BAA77